jgi:iron complex outermembrane receptor protein
MTMVTATHAQDNTEFLEEVVVTGSYIRSTPGDAVVPVQVMGRDQIESFGATTAADIIRKLSISSGSENESDSFTQGSTQGTSNVNLRGLGLSSTLVLINGRRQTISGATANDGSVFVDTSTIPVDAIARVEILKEGAASIYGSDAIAGVVNFILRKNFDGLEFSAGYSTTDNGGQEDLDVGFVWGGGNNKTNYTVSAHYLDRSPLSSSDRPNTVDNAISTLGTTFLPLAPTTVASGDYAGSYGFLENVPQANCESNEGGVLIPQASGARCGFQYGPRFNLVNTETRLQLYGNLSHEFDSGTELFAELGISNNEVKDNPQSPSYPYLSFPVIGGTHPGNPFGVPVVWLGRPLSAGFESPLAPRENDTVRASVNLIGEFANGWNWDAALTFSENEYGVTQIDTIQSRLNAGLAGTGGVNGNEYFDPFNPQNNSDSLIEYISGETYFKRTSDLVVLDAVTSGELFEVSGGSVGFAAGIQIRTEGYKVDVNDLYRIELDAEGNVVPADLIFLGGVATVDADRTGVAAFAEANLPISDRLEITAAVRYEELDSDSSLDPKIGLRWELSDKLVMRASASTSFREPSLSQLNATQVSLQGIQDFNADGTPTSGLSFIRVASKGTPDLNPEESENFNLGFIFTPTDDLQLKLDYWRVDYSDLITQQSAQGLIQQDINGPDIIRTPAGSLIGINTVYFNSSNVEVDGLDFEAVWNINDAWNVRANVSRFLSYDLTLDNGTVIDALGSFNHDNFARSLPETKANVFLNWVDDKHKATLIYNFINSYETTRAVPVDESASIDSFSTVDAQYSYNFAISDNADAVLSLGIKNMFDEEPPRVYDAANFSYDAKQHSPLGRVYYARAKFQF